ncbi:MAG: hypothetical protein IJ511_05910 [Bacteroides sp.]|nr:hypothetical protein [Bacteroides sp.]
MVINKEIIRNNGGRVVRAMKRACRYTFDELQRITLLGSTELCLALIQLLQEHKIAQGKGRHGVYYILAE